MPATSKKQQTAMRMALAARKGDLEVSKLKGAALDIYKSDMTDKEIEDFTVLKENVSITEYIKNDMKDLKQYILEARGFKYCVNYFNKMWNRILTNDWKKVISSEPVSGASYWDVSDMRFSNSSEPDSLVAWHGENGYWANKYEISKNPEKCGKWDRPFKGKDLEKIEKCKQ